MELVRIEELTATDPGVDTGVAEHQPRGHHAHPPSHPSPHCLGQRAAEGTGLGESARRSAPLAEGRGRKPGCV